MAVSVNTSKSGIVLIATSITTPQIISKSAVAVTLAADTNENTAATISLPGGSIGPNGFIRIWTHWAWTSSANTKTIRYRLGGIGGTTLRSPSHTTTTNWTDFFVVANRNAQNSQLGLVPIGVTDAFVASSTAMTSSAIDMSADTTLVITGQKASGGETLTLEGYLCEAFYGE